MDPTESIYDILTKKGWSFKNAEAIKTLIRSFQNSLESIESELLSIDLRSIGAKSLPDPSSLKKSSHLDGPKVLQLVSLRDISQSSIDASFKNPQRQHRLLRFVLTDGKSEVTSIEYAPIPFITEEIIPGTKICLANKIPIRNGILCLNPKVMTVMGGVVSSLYEEWQMNQKYSVFSRSSLRLSQNENGAGPSPFEKLQIEARPFQVSQRQGLRESTSKFHSYENDSRQQGSDQGQQAVGKGWHSKEKADKPVDDAHDGPKMMPATEKIEEKPCSSVARPKEVSEAVPVQNQAAAQKLLQKMSQPTDGDRNSRSHKHRLKGKQEETQVFTLEEWERRKGNSLKPTMAGHNQDVSRDEELARQLQNQLDFEDFHLRPQYTEAEQVRMSMFSFGGPGESGNDDRRNFRGRGRGRGRSGRGRFN